MQGVKITNFQREKNGSSRSEKDLNGTIVNRTCHSITEGSQAVKSPSKKEMIGLSLQDFKLKQSFAFASIKTTLFYYLNHFAMIP